MGSTCSCGLPWVKRNDSVFCAHCDVPAPHVALLCSRCRAMVVPKP